MTDSFEGHDDLIGLVRRLNASVIDAELDDVTRDKLVEAIGEAVALVEARPSSRWWQRQPRRSGFAENSPFGGTLHPLAPTFELYQVDGSPLTRMEARIRLGSLYEGPPGAVHGGMVAALFDEVFAATQHVASGDRGRRTARLSVRYRHATPIDTDLVLDARVTKISGRRCALAATLSAGDVVTASAEALFVETRPARS